jgi:CBS domain-containing protein
MTQLIDSVLPTPRRPIVVIKPQLVVADCIEMMVTNDIGALVVHDGKRLLGIVSERDIVRAAMHHGFDLQKTTAGEIAYVKVNVLSVEDSIETAMTIITRTKRRYIIVTEKEQLVAILSIGDLLFHLLEDKSRVIEHLENYIHS